MGLEIRLQIKDNNSSYSPAVLLSLLSPGSMMLSELHGTVNNSDNNNNVIYPGGSRHRGVFQ